jgi:hypothetical protein
VLVSLISASEPFSFTCPGQAPQQSTLNTDGVNEGDCPIFGDATINADYAVIASFSG